MVLLVSSFHCPTHPWINTPPSSPLMFSLETPEEGLSGVAWASLWGRTRGPNPFSYHQSRSSLFSSHPLLSYFPGPYSTSEAPLPPSPPWCSKTGTFNLLASASQALKLLAWANTPSCSFFPSFVCGHPCIWLPLSPQADVRCLPQLLFPYILRQVISPNLEFSNSPILDGQWTFRVLLFLPLQRWHSRFTLSHLAF